MPHFDSTTDALLVLSWLSIDHRCSLTNCGKVICLRNRNYRHDLYSPSQQTHIISLSSSKRLCSDIQTSTILHNHKNPWARPSEGTPDGKGGRYYPSKPTEQLSSIRAHLEMPQTCKDTQTPPSGLPSQL